MLQKYQCQTTFKQYVKYEGRFLKKKEICNGKLKNAFSSLKNNKSPRYDCISSNIIKMSPWEAMWGGDI